MAKIHKCIFIIFTLTLITVVKCADNSLCNSNVSDNVACDQHCRSVQKLHKLQEVGGNCIVDECLCKPSKPKCCD